MQSEMAGLISFTLVLGTGCLDHPIVWSGTRAQAPEEIRL
jgi:hypothetical protein